jgi:hypothetical protein
MVLLCGVATLITAELDAAHQGGATGGDVIADFALLFTKRLIFYRGWIVQ